MKHSDQNKERLFAVEFVPAPADIPLLEEALAAFGRTCSSWRDDESGTAVVRVLCATRAEAEQLAPELDRALDSWGDLFRRALPSARPVSIPREDWADSWKKHFHAFRASKRLVVKPTWEHFEAPPGDIVLEIDPGMCFGTGYHGTTRACLAFMDDLAPELGPVPFLDAGCGSGILSLAAAALGYRPIHAFDCDPDAVRTTRENLAAAGIREVPIETADVADFSSSVRFRVAAANILAPVLVQYREAISGWLDRDRPSYLLLAGILNEQYEEVRRVYLDLGFREVRTRTIDEWTSGCFRLGKA